MVRRGAIFPAVVGALLAFAVTLPASADVNPIQCRRNVDNALASVGLGPDRIGWSDIYERRTRQFFGRDDDVTAGYIAWARVVGCPTGYVVVNLNRFCRPRSIYTRDGCAVPGLPAY